MTRGSTGTNANANAKQTTTLRLRTVWQPAPAARPEMYTWGSNVCLGYIPQTYISSQPIHFAHRCLDSSLRFLDVPARCLEC